VERYQDANDPVEAERLRRETSQELFGADAADPLRSVRWLKIRLTS